MRLRAADVRDAGGAEAPSSDPVSVQLRLRSACTSARFAAVVNLIGSPAVPSSENANLSASAIVAAVVTVSWRSKSGIVAQVQSANSTSLDA